MKYSLGHQNLLRFRFELALANPAGVLVFGIHKNNIQLGTNNVENQRKSFINVAIALFAVGGLSLFLASRMTCIVGQCLFVTQGDSIWDSKGVKLDKTVAGLLQASPPYILGLGGVFLLAGLLKTDSES